MNTKTFIKVVLILLAVLLMAWILTKCLGSDPTTPAVATNTTGIAVTAPTVTTPTTQASTTTTKPRAKKKATTTTKDDKPFTG